MLDLANKCLKKVPCRSGSTDAPIKNDGYICVRSYLDEYIAYDPSYDTLPSKHYLDIYSLLYNSYFSYSLGLYGCDLYVVVRYR